MAYKPATQADGAVSFRWVAGVAGAMIAMIIVPMASIAGVYVKRQQDAEVKLSALEAKVLYFQDLQSKWNVRIEDKIDRLLER